MHAERDGHDLSEILTDWVELSLIRRRGGSDEEAKLAQSNLLNRYSSAIRRYVRVAVRDDSVVDEIYQIFAVRFLEGKFRHADPQRGRFRDYLKTSLFHLVADFKRQDGRFPRQWPAEGFEPAVQDPTPAQDEEFRNVWREEILSRAWLRLEDLQRREGLPFAAVLSYHRDNPRIGSEQLARHFSARYGRPISAVNIRRTMMCARRHLEDAVVAEISQTLDVPTREAIEEELCELGLHATCGDAIGRIGARGRSPSGHKLRSDSPGHPRRSSRDSVAEGSRS